jgi:hypothetical protein
MAETHQEIKDRLLKTASALWGHKDTQAENNFDPLVGILLGACATELKKIAHDIEDSRTRVLERLVQLLCPEVLVNAIPAHAIAYAYPSEKQLPLNAGTQFYTTKKQSSGDDPNANKNIFFTPTGNFILSRASITAIATTRKVYAVKDTLQKEVILNAPGETVHPFQHSLWIAIEQAATLPAETVFFFELRNEAQRSRFYHSLPTAKWIGAERTATTEPGYGTKNPLHGKPDPQGIVNGKTSITSRINKHVNTLYAPQFITVTGLTTAATSTAWPKELNGLYPEDDIKKLKPEYLSWVRIDFPENINTVQVADDLYIGLNCFPITNLQLIVAQHKLMDYTNIIPLASDGFFADLAEVVDMEGNPLGMVHDTGENSDIQLHYGGVERFNEKDALFAIEGMIQQLRDESSAFKSIGNEFMNTELKTLQQSLNKLEQETNDRQALKSDTPYLIISDKAKTGTSNIYIKYRATNGAAANHIKTGNVLHLYKGPDIKGNVAKLVTPTTGGRDSLNSRDKVLAYKTALLSKEKLVTEEDIASFCRLRLALGNAHIQIRKGYQVNNHLAGGFSKTMDVHIGLSDAEMRQLAETGSVEFWQQDLALSVNARAHLLMPLRVFINPLEK